MQQTSLMQRVTRFAAVALAGVLPLLGGGAAAIAGGGAGGATYNDLSNDAPTLQVWDSTRQAWGTSVTASNDETRSILIYAHQTNTDVIAQTLMKLSLPSAASTSHNLTALVNSASTRNASNGAAVTPATVIAGNGSATITTTQATTISLVTDTTDAALKPVYYVANAQGQLVPTNFPGSQNPANVIGSGISAGDQKGCWQYTVAMKFSVRITPAGPPAVKTNKKVAKVAANEVYGDATSVRPSDEISYRIYLQNEGAGTGTTTRIVDELDARQTFLPGSAYIVFKQNNVDQTVLIPDANIKFENLTNGNTRMTVAWYDMPARPDAAIYLYFKATIKGADAFPAGPSTTTFNNCAVTGFSQVTATTNCVAVSVVREATPVVSFSLRKEVANVSLNDGQWHDDQLPGVVTPGQKLAYSITVSNTGNTDATNVQIKDQLPAGLTYTGNAKIYDRQNPNGVSVDASSIVAGGYTLPSLLAGNTNYKQIVFEAVVPTTCSGTVPLVNTAMLTWNGAERARDTATANLTCTAGILIQKMVRNSAGAYVSDAGIVGAGQSLSYRITVSNSGNQTLTNVRLTDTLPTSTQFVSGTLTVDGEVQAVSTEQAFLNTQGMLLTNLAPGMTKTVEFTVKIDECPVLGDTPANNTATVSATGVAATSSTARAIIRVNLPTF